MGVIAVDDHEVVRNGLVASLAADPGLRVVGVAASAREALQVARRTSPDAAIIDLRLPDMTGEELCRRLIDADPDIKVVMLTTYLSEETVRAALDAGAAGYVTKAAGVAKLRETLAQLASGADAGAARNSAQEIVKKLHRDVDGRMSTGVPTPHQIRVLELAAEGFTNNQIGERLYISESTVRFHMQKLKRHFAARTRTELVARAIRTGAIAPAPEAVADHGRKPAVSG